MTQNDQIRDFALIRDWRERRLNELVQADWIHVYLSQDNRTESSYDTLLLFPAIVPKADAADVLNNPDWEIQIIDSPYPGFIEEYDENRQPTYRYQRFSWSNNLEPLILLRSYSGYPKDHIELSEEFRLYHNLYFDIEKQLYLKFNYGEEIEVARIEPRSVSIHRKQLLQFLAAKQHHLVIYFDILRLTNFDVSRIPEKERETTVRTQLMRYHFDVQNWHNGFSANSLLRGKSLIISPAIEQCGIYPYEEETKNEDFIIGVDDLGNEVTSTCNPKLVDYTTSPNILTPVYFSRDVLMRYYGDPHRYIVGDSYIEQFSSWYLHADTNNDNYVIVFLGDLGRSLPYREQQYWRAHNIVPPANPRLSSTHYRRLIRGEWVEPTEKSLLFKSQFSDFQERWLIKNGWELFRKLHPDDQHYWTGLHRPISDNLRELEDMATSLTKIVVESLNDEELKQRVAGVESGEKSIKKLQRFLAQEGCPVNDDQISVLNSLYYLRTNAAAHRKDSENYARIADQLRIGKRSVIEIADEIFTSLIELIDALDSHFLSNNQSDYQNEHSV